MAKWNENQNRIIYEDYNDFLTLQKGRMIEFTDFDPLDETKVQLVFDLDRFYEYAVPKVLDAGCRDGWSLCHMKKKRIEAIGIDVIQENIDRCTQRGVKAYQQNCENLEFPDETFGSIFCRHTLEHVIKPDQAIREFVRVLKPGGICYIVIPIQATTKKRKLKYGHSFVFEKSSVLLQMIKDMPVEVVSSKFDEPTPSDTASTYVLRKMK